MKIPEKITIAGITYTINEEPTDSSKLGYNGLDGIIIYDKCLINLDKDMMLERKEQTLIHELTHGVLNTLNLNKDTVVIDERFVESFSQLWYQVIKQL